MKIIILLEVFDDEFYVEPPPDSKEPSILLCTWNNVCIFKHTLCLFLSYMKGAFAKASAIPDFLMSS